MNPKNIGLKHKSISELEQYTKDHPSWMLVEELKLDHRKGARKLADKLHKRLINMEQAQTRINELFNYQAELARSNGAEMVVGIDEAGRGPLAGPLVACAVMMDVSTALEFSNLDDSKKLTEAERSRLYSEITSQVTHYSFGVVSSKLIDSINIHQAVNLSILKCVEKLPDNYDLILVDGNFVPDELRSCGMNVTKGDQKVAAISAASILAKVTRDNIMKRVHKQYPQYNFAANKGYGSTDHIQAIKNHGANFFHRKSFLSKIYSEV